MANKIDVKRLLEAGVHFGHMTQMGSNMAPYIYMERNGIHIINLYKTAAKLKKLQTQCKNCCIWKKNLFVTKNKQRHS
jgi:small subunit ribosomal protein S2